MQVLTGGARTFSALTYQNQHPENQSYFMHKFNTFNDNLTDAGKSFLAGAAELYDKFNGSEAMRLAKATLRKVKSIWDRDDIRELFGIGELQHAKPIMQRWIMACPEVRSVWQDQRCDGYSDTYQDMHPGKIGADHYDYRRVMDGVLEEFVDDEGEDSFMIVSYIDDLVEGDVELALEEKLDILSTWDMLRMHMSSGGEDPTSPYAGKL